MKDLDSLDRHPTMATTTLDRMPTLYFPSDYSYGHSASYSYKRSYPDHTDWSPSHPNPDELAAALAIAQLSHSKNLVASQAHDRSYKTKNSYESVGDSVRGSWKRSDENVCQDYDISSSVRIKCEPVDDEDDAQQEDSPSFDNARMLEEGNRNQYERYQYLDVNSNKCSGMPVLSPVHQKQRQSPPNMTSPRIVLTAAETPNIRNASPEFESNDLGVCLEQAYDFGKQYALKWVLDNSRQNLSPEKPRMIMSPYGYLTPQRLSPDSRCPSSSSVNLPPTRTERLSSDVIDYQYQYHSESQPSLNSYDLYSRKNAAGNSRLKRFETPSSFLKRKAQNNIDQARRRCYSDDKGQVRQRILQGKFGSLSTLAAYYKQFDNSKHSRLSLDDSAIDLSSTNTVNNKRRISDDTVRTAKTFKDDTAAISSRTTNVTGRTTPELSTAFKLFQLNGTQRVPVDDSKTTSSYSRKYNNMLSLKHSAAVVNGLYNDLECSTTAVRELCQIQTEKVSRSDLTTLDHVTEPQENYSQEITTPNNSPRSSGIDEADDSFEKLSIVEGTSPSRKSRSPTFQMPDYQLPPKKRRMFDTCQDETVNDSSEDCEEHQRNRSGENRTELMTSSQELPSSELLSGTQNAHEWYAGQSRDSSILSAVRPDSRGDLPLHIAVVRGMTSVVERLITLMNKLNIPIDTCNNQKQTALHLAVMKNQPKAVKLLLAAGASPALREMSGNEVIHLAVLEDSLPALRVLIEQCQALQTSPPATTEAPNLDLNAINYEGKTALHLAVHHGNYEAVRLLLEAGVDVDSKEALSGRTALYLALEVEDLRMARLLLKFGANPTICTQTGSSPALLAAEKYQVDLLAILDKCGPLGR